MRQILVVANQTLGGEQLEDAVRDRIAAGPCAGTLVVPVGRPHGNAMIDVSRTAVAHGWSTASTDGAARAEAERRLNAVQQKLRDRRRRCRRG